MSGEKLAFRAILCYLWKNRLNARAVAKEINDGEGPRTVNEHVTQNWSRHFKEYDTNLKYKPKSRRPSAM